MVKKHVFTEKDVYSDIADLPEIENGFMDAQEFLNRIEDFGEWKELIGYLKGKNLNPKLVKKYIEAVLEIDKLAE
jgi:hypothetical protein